MGEISVKKGDIVLLQFPFSDKNKSKKRPSVVISSPDEDRDIILTKITKAMPNENYLSLSKKYFDFESYIRYDKIITVNLSKISAKIGKLTINEYNALTKKIYNLIMEEENAV